MAPLPLWLAAWMVSTAWGSSCTWPDGAQAAFSAAAPDSPVDAPWATFPGPTVVIEDELATGMGSSFTTSATSGLAASRAASPGDTVADRALMTWNVFTFWALTRPSSWTTGFWIPATAALRTRLVAARLGRAGQLVLEDHDDLVAHVARQGLGLAARSAGPVPRRRPRPGSR